MHLAVAIPGSDPGDKYEGILQDLLGFVTNLLPGTGALDRSCTSEARYTGKDPRDCNIAAILKMKDPETVYILLYSNHRPK